MGQAQNAIAVMFPLNQADFLTVDVKRLAAISVEDVEAF